MSIYNLHKELKGMLAVEPLLKAVTATLTVKELLENTRINGDAASTQIDLTLPAADAALNGAVNIIKCAGAAVVTVICTEGFGGVGSGGDTLTLAQGEFVIITADADDWYCLHNEPSA